VYPTGNASSRPWDFGIAGIRASELQGLQVQDVILSDIPGTLDSIRVVRTALQGDGSGTTERRRASHPRIAKCL
jgi:hypothetical protein